MRTYLLIGGIMAAIACILFWFLWPIQVVWIVYLLFLRITNKNKLNNLECDIHEELTSEEES